MNHLYVGVLTVAIAVFLNLGCGYTLHGARSALLEDNKIQTLYIDTIRNDSYRVLVDGLLYDALIKNFRSGNRVRLVSNPADADAVLVGRIVNADSSSAGERGDVDGMVVSTQYSAGMNCQFQLKRNLQTEKTLWVTSIGRSKLFQASARTGVAGTTSALINDSDFERAIVDVANQIAIDLQDAMLETF